MRDAIAPFEQQLARCNGRKTTPDSIGFMGMMERVMESLYDILLATIENTDSKSNSKGSYPLMRECNMLHVLEDGAARRRTRRMMPT